MINYLLPLYTFLLRLYPPDFRAEFAEEMQGVFALALADAEQEGVFTLVGTWLAELRDLPLSVVREHLRERRQKQLNLEGIMVIAETPIRIYRFCAYSLLLIAAAYGLLVVLPFFAYGLHLQPANLITGGYFDPKGYPIYQSSLGAVIRIATFSVMLVGPIWLVILGIRLAFALGRNWTRLLAGQRWLGVAAFLAGLSVWVFMVSPLGRLIITWFAD